MRSPLIEDADYIADKRNYSQLMVLRSNAGWYIGTLYNNPDGYREPGSRDSEYFPTEAAAELALKNQDWYQRDRL